jgi:hypothetical protein
MENIPDFIHNNKYSLSIRFSSDGFSLCIYDESTKILSGKNIPASFQSLNEDTIYGIITKEVETQLDFQNIRIICESDIYTLIPTAFFKPETATYFLHFEHTANKNETIFHNHLPAWGSTLITSLPSNLHNAIKKAYPNIPIEHHLTSFLTDNIQTLPESNISVWVRPKMLDVAVIKGRKIALLNSFSFNTPEDFTFHILNIFEHLALNTETCNVIIYNTDKNSKTIGLLQNYMKEISVIN